jgi:RNA polymerase-binding transcription factor DksA
MLISVFRGTYGKCAACGRQIEVPRLEAVPWAV